jgi:hypothetical protein
LTGFVVYQFIARNSAGDRITRDIVAKLRTTHAGALPGGGDRLTPAALAKALDQNARLKAEVDVQDFELLRDALRRQFITNLFVYSLCGVLFLVGVGLFTWNTVRPHPVVISNLSLQGGGRSIQPVDTQPLLVRWTADGDREDVSISLLNTETSTRGPALTANSDDGRLLLQPDQYHGVLSRRGAGEANPLRVIVQTHHSAFNSPVTPVQVGITVEAVKFDESRIRIVPMIDNAIVQDWPFEAKLLVWTKPSHGSPEPVTFGGQLVAGNDTVRPQRGTAYDWSTAKLVFFGPGDPKMVETELDGF